MDAGKNDNVLDMKILEEVHLVYVHHYPSQQEKLVEPNKCVQTQLLLAAWSFLIEDTLNHVKERLSCCMKSAQDIATLPLSP